MAEKWLAKNGSKELGIRINRPAAFAYFLPYIFLPKQDWDRGEVIAMNSFDEPATGLETVPTIRLIVDDRVRVTELVRSSLSPNALPMFAILDCLAQ